MLFSFSLARRTPPEAGASSSSSSLARGRAPEAGGSSNCRLRAAESEDDGANERDSSRDARIIGPVEAPVNEADP
jgi:hypothetical protein